MAVGRINNYVDMYRFYGMGTQGETPERKTLDSEEAEPEALEPLDQAGPSSPPSSEEASFLSLGELSAILKECTRELLKTQVYSSADGRFPDIFCPKATALSFEGRVLHANEVGKTFSSRSLIASQAPFEKDRELFWQIVLQKSPLILDLTGVDDVYTEEKAYYPKELEETLFLGAISVTLIKVTDAIYTYEVKSDQQISYITRYHYTAWPDYQAISLQALEELIQRVDDLAPDLEAPLWVHCHAGVGRTGSFLASLMLREGIDTGHVTEKNLDQTIIDIIAALRRDRGHKCVISSSQLNLVRNFGLHLLGSFID